MKKIAAFLCVLCLFLSLSPFCLGETPPWIEVLVNIPNGDHEIPATICLPFREGQFPAVVLLHGTGSNRNEGYNAFGRLAHKFAETYGIATIRIDFMGCGDSKADYFGYTFDSAVSDASIAAEVMQALDYIDSEHIGVLGWSQGGTDALLCASRRPDLFKSVVTWAGTPDLNNDLIFTEDQYGEAKENGFYRMSLFDGRQVKVSLQWCEDVLHTDVLGDFTKNYSGPVFAIQGTADMVVDPIWCEKIAEASTNPASSFLYIDGMDHLFNVLTEDDFHSLFSAIDAAGEFFSKTLK